MRRLPCLGTAAGRAAAVLGGLAVLAAMLPAPAAARTAADTGARAPARGPGAPVVTVCASCEAATVQQGLARLAPGGTLRVRPGHYRGPFVVDRPAHLVGIGNPVLDGGGKGTVVRLRAVGSSIEGFTVRGSGDSLDHEDTGISVEAARATVRGNRLRDVLFGVYAKKADRSLIDGNSVTGKDYLPVGEKGDGIRVWYSPSITVRDNTVRGVRDNLMWFSDGCTISGNRFLDSRYGIHLMWSSDCRITRNVVRGHSVGLYAMFSRRLRITDNTFRDNRSSTGVGIGLRDSDGMTVSGNRLNHNRVGLWLFNSPDDPTDPNHFTDNLLVHNDIGVSADSNTHGDAITGNDFIDNVQQVGGDDEDALTGITWAAQGRGNYWSDYGGYDANGDGVGDIPYAPHRTFESLVASHPDFALLSMSPAAKALDWAANAFPVFGSTALITDPSPMTGPVTTAGTAKEEGVTLTLLAGAGVLVLLGLALTAAIRRSGRPARGTAGPGRSGPPPGRADVPAVAVEGLHKAYGGHAVVDGLSFRVAPGEVVALWGDNGAGKTTVLRCLLGLVRHRGQALIGGLPVRTRPREALRLLGHVSQEPAFHGDLTLNETLAFYGRLRGCDRAEQRRVLEVVGLTGAGAKKVAELSGGMRRKLAVAVALLGEPRVLLLDEPTANLDQRSRSDLVALLGELKATGIAMVLATHQPDEVLALADRVLKLAAGRAPTETDLAAFGRVAAAGPAFGHATLTVPAEHREQAARLLLDAGIPAAQGDRPAHRATTAHGDPAEPGGQAGQAGRAGQAGQAGPGDPVDPLEPAAPDELAEPGERLESGVTA